MSYGLLKGKRGIIFGALDENSIAWKTAERVHEEGGSFVLTNAPIAMRMGTINQLAEKLILFYQHFINTVAKYIYLPVPSTYLVFNLHT